MNENITKQLLEYLEQSKDFALEQAPEIIQQSFTYEKVSSYFNLGISAFLLMLALSASFYFWKYPNLDKYGSREFGSVIGAFFPLAFSPVFIGQIFISFDKLLKMHLAPKFYLIQLISELKK